jgi:hypothetical protein
VLRLTLRTIAAQKFEEGGYSASDMIRDYNPTFTNSPRGYINKPTAWMNLAGEKRERVDSVRKIAS